jgi:haloalkane dehalogenase
MRQTIKDLSPYLREEYPFSSHFVSQKFARESSCNQHYLDEGSGPVIVLLHGNPTWSFYYRNLVIHLSSLGFRCIVPDHVGCGLSDKPENYPYTLERRISDVEHLLDHLGVTHYSLVVHDWGGAIGMGLAGNNPDKISRIAILNSGAFRSKHIPFRIALLRIPILGKILIRGFNAFSGMAINMATTIPLAPVIKKGLLFPYQSWGDRVAIWNFVKDIPMRSTHPSYQCVKKVEMNLVKLSDKPIGLFWGEQDFCFNENFLKQWVQFFPNAKLNRYNKAGHYVLEDAQKEIIPEIGNFFQQNT